VNRHHLRRPARRDQQGMGSMDDIRRAGECFNRRPPRPVPQQIQQSDGDTAVDDPRTEARAERTIGTVLPRARKECDVAGIRCGVGLYEPMNVFADSGALPERGPVVDEDSHLVARPSSTAAGRFVVAARKIAVERLSYEAGHQLIRLTKRYDSRCSFRANGCRKCRRTDEDCGHRDGVRRPRRRRVFG
jgi:hypothetical protein